MQPSDFSANFNATVVIVEAMRKAGLKVDIQPLDRGTLSQRGNNKGPVDKGAGTCSSPSPRRSMPAHRSPIPTSPPVPQRRRGLSLRRGAPAPQLVGEHRRSRTRATRRPDPGAGVSGRAVRQRRAVEAVYGCADECLGVGGDDGAGVLGGGEGRVSVARGSRPLKALHLRGKTSRRHVLSPMTGFSGGGWRCRSTIYDRKTYRCWSM
jgi:hypothetical protein